MRSDGLAEERVASQTAHRPFRIYGNASGLYHTIEVCNQQLVGAGVYIQIVSKNLVPTKEIFFFSHGEGRGCILNFFFSSKCSEM